VQLHELPGALGATIRLATRNGETEARLTLDPGDLGQVQIRLRYGAGGLTAELTAETAQAMQALRETAGELRRALESQGITIAGLDVSTAGSGRSSQGDPEARHGAGTGTPFARGGDDAAAAPAAPAQRTVLGLVDVLA
jgi:flagellar hook-length control protein FliK